MFYTLFLCENTTHLKTVLKTALKNHRKQKHQQKTIRAKRDRIEWREKNKNPRKNSPKWTQLNRIKPVFKGCYHSNHWRCDDNLKPFFHMVQKQQRQTETVVAVASMCLCCCGLFFSVLVLSNVNKQALDFRGSWVEATSCVKHCKPYDKIPN